MSNLSALELRRIKELERARAQGARRVQQAAERQARGRMAEAENVAVADEHQLDVQSISRHQQQPNSAIHQRHPASSTSYHHPTSSLLHHPNDVSSPRHMDVARHMAEEHRLRSQFHPPVATQVNPYQRSLSAAPESEDLEMEAKQERREQKFRNSTNLRMRDYFERRFADGYMTADQWQACDLQMPPPSSARSTVASVSHRPAPAALPISHDQRPIRPSHPPGRGASSSSQSFEHRLNAVMAARAAERENYARAQFEQQEREELAEHKSSMDKAADALKPFPVTAAWKRTWQTKTHTGECAICLDQFRLAQQIIQLPSCSHAFHEPCLSHWLVRQSTCPTCRFDIKQMRPATQLRRSEEDDEEFSL